MNLYIFSENIFLVKDIDLPHKEILKELKNLTYVKVPPQIRDPMYDTKQHITGFKVLDNLYFGKQIKLKMEECLTNAIDSFGYESGFKICNSWVNKIEPHNYSEWHNHKNFWLSLVYYPHGDFSIAFLKNDVNFFDVKKKRDNPFTNNMFSVTVSAGTMIVFQSYLQNKIGYNFSEENRYSIAVNILPKGNIGVGDGQINFM